MTSATVRLKTTKTAVTTARMISFVVIGRDYDNRLGWAAPRSSDVSVAALLVAAVLAALGVGEVAGALTDWQAFVLGAVQGFTELLPISSSAHLILVPWLADWHFLQENEAFNQTFDVALHLGTLVAVVGYFWPEFVRLVRGLLGSIVRRRIQGTDEWIAWLIVIATIPAAVIGALGEDTIVDHLGEPWQMAILLAVFGILLYVADRQPQTKGDRRPDASPCGRRWASRRAWRSCPGCPVRGSRSPRGGSWASTATRPRGSRSSCSIPTTAGAVIWKGFGDVLLGDLPPGWKGPFVVGMLAALGSGLLAIHWLLGYVRRTTTPSSSSTASSWRAIILLLIATGVREATF